MAGSRIGSACLVAVLLGACADEGPSDWRTQASAPVDVDPTTPVSLPADTRPIVTDPPDDPPTACVDDVPGRFRGLSAEVAVEQYLSATHLGDVLPWPRYTDSVANGFGFLEHFQGIQRAGRHLLITGGVANGARMSQLIVVEMGSRDERGTWAPAVGDAPFAPGPTDRVVAAHDLEPTLWHAGGFQLAEDIAAVPLAGDEPAAGEVRFYDLTDPSAPRELAPRVTRSHELYVAALARISDGRFLVLWWDDEVIELQLSLTADLEDGLADESFVVDPSDVGGFQEGGCGVDCGTYQSMNLVGDCDGRLFVVATRNTNKLAPTIPGDELASLYELTWPASGPALSLVERRSFECADRQCNFAAAAGVHVLEHDLVLYAAYHWLQDDGGRLQFNEYAAP